MHAHHPARAQRAFTYVETLIAVALLLIGLLGMAASLLTMRRLNESSLADAQALSAARLIIEDIQAIADPAYVIAHLDGHTVMVPGLNGPALDHAFADGSMPSFRASSLLPPVDGSPPPAPPPPDADPALGYELAGQAILLPPASDAHVAYATIDVDSSVADLIHVRVDVIYSCQGTNRKHRFHTQILRPQ